MFKFLAFHKDESGSTAIEYGLIAALIGLVVVSGITAVGSSTDSLYEMLTNTIGTAIS
ncbi:MAG: Flp family type IVb pilin [Rhizobiaceae bacterium]